MSHTLVIVESPTKARTIKGFLPKDFQIEASMGHVRDLPNSAGEIPAAQKGEKWAKDYGVNPENNFEPLYVVPSDKKKIVRQLKTALKQADELLLATDEDREGESISWHLLQLLAPKVPVKRLVFHEITKEAISNALDKKRDLDMALVHAQETRRILDRLVGYTLSPLLWKKVAYGLSAGRVQSVAVRLLVQRERARRSFRSGSYWDLKAKLELGSIFEAKLTQINGLRVATGNDFDESTGSLKSGSKVHLLKEEEATNLAIKSRENPWLVSSVEEKPTQRKPVPPFTTSTLQQEANRKLRLSARDTMRCAQGLYERGFITYMRTDSVNLSEQAIHAARESVETRYGKNYLSKEPRKFKNKARNAQEAHEAIRPAGETFKTPNESGLRGRDLSLYELIWKRTVASQMADARLTIVGVEFTVANATFRSSGKRIDFPGFFRAYVEGSDDPEAALEGQEVLLPKMSVGSIPIAKEVQSISHKTKPPSRYSEASLVKVLEQEGIGRPSTYASIIGTITDRGYASLLNNSLTPSFTAFAVTALLEEHFPELVDTSFTAKMESTLDEISTGKVSWVPYLEDFFKGDKGLRSQVDKREGDIDPSKSRNISLEGLSCDVRISRYGAYLETKRIGEDGKEEIIKANLPKDIAPADLDFKKAELFLKQKAEGPDPIGEDPESGEKIYLLYGQFGPYLQKGLPTDEVPKPKRASLPRGLKPEDVSLEQALGLLKLPRLLGEHENGGKIQAGLGRFGPYIVWNKGKGEKDYRSIKGDDDVLAIDLGRALELLSMPKRGRGGRTSLKDLGTPEGSKENIQIFDGPYGLYVKQGKINASLPEGKKAEDLTIQDAVELLAEKSSNKKISKRVKATTKKTKATTKKTKATTKKSTATTKKSTATTKKTSSAKQAKAKAPATTKSGRLRASAVRVIRPADR